MTTLTLRTGGLWDDMEDDQEVVLGNKFTIENDKGEGVMVIELLPNGGGVQIHGGSWHKINGVEHSGVLSIIPRSMTAIEIRTVPANL